jgi:hypothetical protein
MTDQLPEWNCRVALGIAPRAPTDPDVQISRIRLVESRIRGETVH